ncbi:MAG: hypothetical protein COC08_00045 [Maribacter sp.]|nr:MAG: hypothetical protein COC08_00045 [Maribacter sp.]
MAVYSFKKWNTFLGWAVFGIALTVYVLTEEPSVSFWDSGGYIATSAKLQVAHSPGAPLLQMIGAFFALFATGPNQIARMVNYVSVISSAFTILFLFWTITNLTQKLVPKKIVITKIESAISLASGVIGALTFTFSDSFWFNATETEVYSMASFVMAVLLWLGLRWTDDLDNPRSDKWLILISFVVGLTFGVQFMGFLTVPSIGLLFYFKKYKTITFKNFVLANIIAVLVLLLVFKFSLTYVLKLFGWSEVFFVNSIGMPFNSGSLIMGLIFVSAFYLSLRFTRKKGYRTANTIALSLLFLVLGFSSWLLLPIRASANVVINENNPADARSLLAYYDREQYPSTDSPFYGAYYSTMFASDHSEKNDRPKYERDESLNKYVIVNSYEKALRGSSKRHTGFLPRMWSEANAENYIRYYGAPEFSIKPEFNGNEELQEAVFTVRKKYATGGMETDEFLSFLKEVSDYIDVKPPTVWENVKYMFHFQFGYMYWRYFMWNFVGRQNDEQGRFNGNGEWISGIRFLDALRIGSQENLPSEVLNNKGRNTYFFLPLILGVIGLVFQMGKNRKQFWVLFVFFVFTGIAIQFYTNPPIFQPRERDYSLVGSFYVFAIWIGLGVHAIFDVFRKRIRSKIIILAVFVPCFLAVPGLMAHQNWDDHDRSDRYTALSMAKAYLDSTQENAGAILFTIGDNDTFPLWYAQDVEAYRTDARVIISGYLNFPWYIDQMKRKAYKSNPIPSQLTHGLYKYGSRDVIYYAPMTDKRWPISDFMKWVASNRPETKVKSLMEKQGRNISQFSKSYLDAVFYPTNKIRIPVNKEMVLKNHLVKEQDSADIVEFIDIDLPETGISKGQLVMLDIIANNNWKRPIYFSGGSFDEKEYIWMSDYLQLDGLVYKLVPIKTKNKSIFDKGRIDSELMYEIVKKWEWGNSGNRNIYHNPQTRKQGISYRISLARLMEKLLKEDKIEKAKEIIDIATLNMPIPSFGYYTTVEPFVDGYYKVGEKEKARKLFHELKAIYQERLHYYAQVSLEEQYKNFEEILSDLRAYSRIVDILIQNGDTLIKEKEVLIFDEYIEMFETFFNS